MINILLPLQVQIAADENKIDISHNQAGHVNFKLELIKINLTIVKNYIGTNKFQLDIKQIQILIPLTQTKCSIQKLAKIIVGDNIH